MKVIVIQNPSGFDVPVGGILLWYGLAGTVPPGFEIYAEAKNHFILGGSAVDLTSRGALTHTHEFPNIAAAPNHTHGVSVSVSGYPGGVGVGLPDENTASSQNHVHAGSGSTSSAGAHGNTLATSGAGSSLPKYKRLYYIRRVQ